MQTIIYRLNGLDNVTTINNQQLVTTKAAFTETVAATTQQQPDPNDPDLMIDVVIPEHEVNHPAEKNVLSGQNLVDWFIASKAPSGQTIDFFVCDPNGPLPLSRQVINVDYTLKTWENPAPVITADMVRAECERRMILLLGARDKTDLDIKVSNGSREAIRLLRKETDEPGAWTPDDEARKTELIAADAGLEVLRAASNALEASLPADYTDDIHWP